MRENTKRGLNGVEMAYKCKNEKRGLKWELGVERANRNSRKSRLVRVESRTQPEGVAMPRGG